MAYEQPGFKPTGLKAGADLSTAQFFAVKISGDLLVALAGDGEKSIGILQNDPTSGQAATIVAQGICKAKLGASVTAGQSLASDASGKLIPAASGKTVVAQALEAGSNNELKHVYMTLESAPLA